jgi:Txe/YoeB family toxin of toxin-antitoxin system
MLGDAGLVSEPWRVVFTKAAQKDARKVGESGLKTKAEELIGLLREDPFRNPPPYEKLIGDLAGTFSRRINRQHRLIYSVHKEERTVKVLRMWTHYE